MVTMSQELQILLWGVTYICNSRKCSASLITQLLRITKNIFFHEFQHAVNSVMHTLR